jgi:hypothetical protein
VILVILLTTLLLLVVVVGVLEQVEVEVLVDLELTLPVIH